jgi:hypothetical protein
MTSLTRSKVASGCMTAAALVVLFTHEALAAQVGCTKFEICHFPPGNPGNAQTITISASALASHLAHGDYGGLCANNCELFAAICDDGNKCTVDTCNGGSTCSHSATNCDDGDPCTQDSCNSLTGECVNTPTKSLDCEGQSECSLANCPPPNICVQGTCYNTMCPDVGPCYSAAYAVADPGLLGSDTQVKVCLDGSTACYWCVYPRRPDGTLCPLSSSLQGICLDGFCTGCN